MNFRLGISLVNKVSPGNKPSWIAGYYYIKNCLNAIATLPHTSIPLITLFVPEDYDEEILFPEHKTNSNWLKIVAVPCLQNGYCTELQKYIEMHPCDIYLPFNDLPDFSFCTKMISWIPDFQDKHIPQWFSEADIAARELKTHFLLKFSNKIFCSSQTVRKDLEKFYPFAKDKAVIVKFRALIPQSYLCISEAQDVLKKYNIDRKYIYLPNQFWKHKNHRMVFMAWSALKACGLNYLLVCTGSSIDYRHPNYFSELQSYLNEHKLHDTVKILGFIDRHDQIQLLRQAAAILQPSLFEGWNTSIEEAKVLGKKLILSDIPIHREQCEAQAYFFQKDDSTHLQKLVAEIWDDLPSENNKANELWAYTNYQKKIETFAEAILQSCQEVMTENSQMDQTCELTLKISSELSALHAHADLRLHHMNELARVNEMQRQSLIEFRLKESTVG